MLHQVKSKPRKHLNKDSFVNLLDGTKIWVEYWRKNPHRFAIEYLQIDLYWFQMVLIYMMNICNIFMLIACRGLGKSWLTSVFCCVRAILYPGSKIILASGNKKQAGNIITEKIVELRRNSPALDREIAEIKTQHDNICCIFKNGSVIRVATSGDGSRGMRGNVLVADEFRLIKEKDINFVLKQFLTAPRKTPFMYKPEYENYPKEANKEIKICLNIGKA